MEPIIDPVSKEDLIRELSQDKFVRFTNYGNNEIYIVDYKNSPCVMREIGRLRELSFRDAGGGTGKSCDIDDFDTAPVPYQQLIVWSKADSEIIGGYRFIDCQKVPLKSNGQPELSTTEIFNFSDTFIKDYLPQTIELGRSFIQPKFQSKQNFKVAIFALDNLWDGLGAIYKVNSHRVKYFFGKVTMYTSYNAIARDYLLAFINKYFKDKDNLVTVFKPISHSMSYETAVEIFNAGNYKDDFKILNRKVRDLGENIPPLINAYMNLSMTMKMFGTALNPFFGDVEESGILINVDDVYPEKKSRHIDTYNN